MARNLIISLIISLSFFTGKLHAQDFLKSMTSGGKLKPLQAIMDIRHYTIALDVDIDQKAINGYAEIELNIILYQINSDTYNMVLNNAPINSLPLDISIDKGMIHTTMDKPLSIKSSSLGNSTKRGIYGKVNVEFSKIVRKRLPINFRSHSFKFG